MLSIVLNKNTFDSFDFTKIDYCLRAWKTMFSSQRKNINEWPLRFWNDRNQKPCTLPLAYILLPGEWLKFSSVGDDFVYIFLI